MRFKPPLPAWAIAAVLLAGVFGAAPSARAADSGSDLKFVLILSRHGIRPPLAKDAVIAKYAAQPWPAWEVPPDFLTPRGAQLVSMLGGYYRSVFIQEGLLTGNPAVDGPRIHLQSDNDERTIESTRVFGIALAPGTHPTVAWRRDVRYDPIFRPLRIALGHPDVSLAEQAVLGRIGHDIPALVRAHQGACDLMQRVLFGDSGVVPPGKISPFTRTPFVGPDLGTDQLVTIEPFHKCMTITDDLLLEYENGKPMSDVGWGRVTPAQLTQLMELHSLYWDIVHRTLYVAQVEASNIAVHILRTLDQAVTGKPVTGALGSPSDRVVVLGAHDTNLVTMGGLLGVEWTMPGTQMNPLLPGSALVFEVRQRHSDGQFVIRLSYIGQTLEQMRNVEPISLDHPPFRAPIFIPACSGPGPSSDAPYASFHALLTRVIDPEFTTLP